MMDRRHGRREGARGLRFARLARLATATGLIALLATAGCTSTAWKDRVHDLAQVLDVGTTWGPGMAASVRVTEVAQLGVGSFDGRAAGLMEGRLTDVREQRSELGVSLLHTYEYRREGSELLDIRQPHYAEPGWDSHPLSWQMECDRQPTDVGFGLHVAWVGVNATLRLAELFDFFAGCIGFDPLNDDAFGRTVEELQQQAQSLDAAKRRAAFDALLRRGEPIHGYAIYTAPDVQPTYQRRAIEAIQSEPGHAKQ